MVLPNGNTMSKLISVKINDDVFTTLERLAKGERMTRNAYINRALKLINRLYSRRQLRKIIREEVRRGRSETMRVLKEYEGTIGDGL